MQRLIHLVIPLFFAAHFSAIADPDVNFSGTLVEEPCVLDPRDSAIELDMGTIISKTLYSHKRTPGKPFSLHLLECDLSLGNNVSITFIGEEDAEQPGLIAPGLGSSAEGVALGIENANGETLIINQPSSSYALTKGNNVIPLFYFVSASQAAIEEKKITPGAITFLIPFKLNYE